MVNGCGCFIERGCMGQALAHLVWGVCLDVGPDCFLLHIKLPPYPSFFCPGPPLPSCPRSDLAQAGQPGAPAAHQVLQPPHAPEEAQTAGSRLRTQVQQAGLQVRGARGGRRRGEKGGCRTCLRAQVQQTGLQVRGAREGQGEGGPMRTSWASSERG